MMRGTCSVIFMPKPSQPHDFPRVVGKQAQLVCSQVMQDLRSDAIVAQVVRIAEPEVGFHGIQTLFLKFVGLEFCRQSDAAALLPQVEQDASFLGDAAHGGVQLAAAVTAAGAEDVSR